MHGRGGEAGSARTPAPGGRGPTVSTLKPIVGTVLTTSPSLSLYNIVVLPAASRPTCDTAVEKVHPHDENDASSRVVQRIN